MINKKWDIRFLNLAKHISQWSKDPSTKVGCVIADNNKRIISIGYNGFPQNVDDLKERYENRNLKYDLIVHAEMNAILFAKQNLENTFIYTYPLFPCVRCATIIAQSGIKNVISLEISDELKSRWNDSINLSKQIFNEANINITFYNKKDL